jgi:hypothetical protein
MSELGDFICEHSVWKTLIVSGDHVSHGHLGFRLRYIGARSLIVYPYVFVAGPNKHLFP